jgi:hypothetical protein
LSQGLDHARHLVPGRCRQRRHPRIHPFPHEHVGAAHADRLDIGALGAHILTATPGRFAAYIKAEQAKWGQAIRESRGADRLTGTVHENGASNRARRCPA